MWDNHVINLPQYTLYRGDIRDGNLLKHIFNDHNITSVIHLAAMAGVRNSLEDPLEYIDVDIKGTVNLLEASRKNKIKRFIFASSSSVYGINQEVPFTEQDRVDLQISPYAAAKRAGELYCGTYNHLYGMSISCLRFFTVYGPRQRPEMAIHLFTDKIYKGEEIPVFGDGTSRRDYTYIDDIVNGVLQALVLEYDFEIFNLGNSYTISLQEIIVNIENALGKRAKIKRLANQKGDVPVTFADISHSKKRLNYNPSIDIYLGIKKFVNWYLEKQA
ncbi:NAD-dependent epimerase/dehydratase family protein [Desulfitibacter alkalitolerans]|uniref:NAD-dependent epimerase/dehydratase family protein n=1 Tax=Desulfitibacter alkalitolerans TaxID=264641 RepID=UPI000685B041|nr:NAD-dependent epimerase/dehydratase family protein [Desulfitibacter alkalitolerans]